ncbi:MAG TPA: hypothetical protein VFJ02_17395 [Vicinamibacterales bacterium]|nr:hypothetical protein [Vicinamibacterales bacterium]
MRHRARYLRRAAVVVITVAVCATAAAAQKEKRVNPNAKAIAEFQEEVAEYIELHRKLEATLPDLPIEATPEQIDQRQRALGALVQDARRGAKPGDIFERDVRPVIRKLLAGLFSGPEGKRLRLTINEENPGEVVKLTVNGRYPDTIPISTIPPPLLSLLPPLPPELEYRFIGTTLILLDSHAHIIVDYLTAAVPR